jgi:hypothetical protein
VNSSRYRVQWLDAAGDKQTVHVFATSHEKAYATAATYGNAPPFDECDIHQMNWQVEYEEVG